MAALTGIEPKEVWRIFEGLCSVPHPSKKEDKIVAYIEKWANDHGFENFKDKIGNLIVRKPATEGMGDRIPVCIQGHVDMVTVADEGVEVDFDNEGIKPMIDGDWVTADGTTLGADNCIGVAMGMAVMESTDIPHPPLELLCSIDEEVDMTGAMNLEPNKLDAKIMINLDSEEWGHFTIGCAGGCDGFGEFDYLPDTVNAEEKFYRIDIKGLQSGHSGIEIHDGRANALKIMTRLVYNLQEKFDITLSAIEGGEKHNAIPGKSFAVIGVKPELEAEFKAYVEEFYGILKVELKTKEPNVELFANPADAPAKVMTKEFSTRLIRTFYALPHGVYRWSPDLPSTAQTSLNFAIVKTLDDKVTVHTNQRSSLASERDELANKVKATLELGGAKAEISGHYPAWPPNTDSKVLEFAKKVYKDMYGEDAVIESIHAALECGIIGEKYPDTEMLSLGPNLKEVHTPAEKCHIPTTNECYKFVCELLKNIPVK
jgi:dipeptidase D